MIDEFGTVAVTLVNRHSSIVNRQSHHRIPHAPSVPAEPVPPRRGAVVCRLVRRAHDPAGARLAGDCAGGVHAHPVADRQREDARGLPVGGQPGDVLTAARALRAVPGPLRVAAEGARGGRRAEPAIPHRRHRQSRANAGRVVHATRRLGPHGRHAVRRTRAVFARAGRHPHHDSRVALPPALVPGPRGASLGRDGHRGRDPRAGAHQARRASRAVARAAAGRLPANASAHRPVCHAAAARRSRAVPRRSGQEGAGRSAPHLQAETPGRARPPWRAARRVLRRRASHRVPARRRHRRTAAQAAGAEGGGAGRGPGEAGQADRDPKRTGRAGCRRAVDLVEHPPAPARPDSRSPEHAALREQPAPRGAPGRHP